MIVEKMSLSISSFSTGLLLSKTMAPADDKRNNQPVMSSIFF